jgi:Ca2+/Na+ antiporter
MFVMETLYALFDWVASIWGPLSIWLKVLVLYLAVVVVFVLVMLKLTKTAPLMDDQGNYIRDGGRSLPPSAPRDEPPNTNVTPLRR